MFVLPSLGRSLRLPVVQGKESLYSSSVNESSILTNDSKMFHTQIPPNIAVMQHTTFILN